MIATTNDSPTTSGNRTFLRIHTHLLCGADRLPVVIAVRALNMRHDLTGYSSESYSLTRTHTLATPNSHLREGNME